MAVRDLRSGQRGGGGSGRDLEAGSLLPDEAGEAHEIKSEDDRPLETFNIYAPRIY